MVYSINRKIMIMKKLYFILLITLIVSLNIYAQAPKIEWLETFGYQNDDGFFTVERTEGSYIVAGYHTNINKIKQGWAINLSNDGIKFWEKKFKYEQENVVTDVVKNADQTYTLVGYTYERKNFRRDLWLMKMSSTSAILKKNIIGGKYKDGAVSVIRTPDKGNIISGYFSSKEKTSAWLYYMNRHTTLLWEKKYETGYDNIPAGAAVGSDNAFYFCYNYMISNMIWRIEVRKLKTNNGTEVDTFDLKTKYPCKANDFITTFDSAFVVCGYTIAPNKQKDFWIEKFSETGQVIWEKTYGWSMNEEANAIYQKIDGNFIVCGYTESKGNGMYDIWVMELDPDGNKIWEKTIGTEANDIAYDCCEADDGGIIIVGSKFNDKNKVDGFALKLK